jgi:hypothetical protein
LAEFLTTQAIVTGCTPVARGKTGRTLTVVITLADLFEIALLEGKFTTAAI